MASTESPATANTLRQVKTLAQSAGALVRSGNFGDAENIYLKILELAPFHGAALSFFAQSAYEKGDMDKALALMDKAIQGNARNPRHYQNRAEIYKSMGRLEDAIHDLDQVQSLLPDFPLPLFTKALLLKEYGERDAAVRTAVTAWRQVPNLETAASAEDIPESTRSTIIECANLIRSTLLIMIDSELDPIIEQHGKTSCRRIFDAVARFTGLNTANVAGLSLEDLSVIKEMSPLPYWASSLGGESTLLQDVMGLSKSLSVKSTGGLVATDIKAAADAEIYRTVMSNLASAPLIPEPDGHVTMLHASSGSHLLNQAGGENWKLTAYLPIEVPAKTIVVLNQDEIKPVPGQLIVSDASLNHYLHVAAGGSALFLCFHIWHPELSPAEVEAVPAVFRAIRKFDTRYRQSQAA